MLRRSIDLGAAPLRPAGQLDQAVILQHLRPVAERAATAGLAPRTPDIDRFEGDGAPVVIGDAFQLVDRQVRPGRYAGKVEIDRCTHDVSPLLR
jgi:hypothetical protein